MRIKWLPKYQEQHDYLYNIRVIWVGCFYLSRKTVERALALSHTHKRTRKNQIPSSRTGSEEAKKQKEHAAHKTVSSTTLSRLLKVILQSHTIHHQSVSAKYEEYMYILYEKREGASKNMPNKLEPTLLVNIYKNIWAVLLLLLLHHLLRVFLVFKGAFIKKIIKCIVFSNEKNALFERFV